MGKFIPFKRNVLFAIALILFVAFELGVFLSRYASESLDKKEGTTVTTLSNKNGADQAKAGSEEITLDGNTYKIDGEATIYDIMHKMANTKIEADAVWGTMEITADKVDILLEAIEKQNWSDKDKLLTMLKRWKSGNFSKCVEEHNYLWDKLGGTMGKAQRLKKN